MSDFYIVNEYYEIIQNKTIFPESDFGLPSRAVGKETYTLLADGNGCISGMQRQIPSLLLCVERAYDNTFVFNETLTLNLSQQAPDCLIDMQIHNMNPIQYAFQILKRYAESLWRAKNFSVHNSRALKAVNSAGHDISSQFCSLGYLSISLWRGAVARFTKCIQLYGLIDPKRLLEVGTEAAFRKGAQVAKEANT